MHDPRDTERELIQQVAPLINQMGIDKSDSRPIFNQAVKAHLQHVHDDLTHYLPTAPRGWGDDNQMPHEWGSLDTYDDTRNALRLAAMLMDRMLDPFDTEQDELKAIHEVIHEAECGLCCVSKKFTDIVFPNMTDEQIDLIVYPTPPED